MGIGADAAQYQATLREDVGLSMSNFNRRHLIAFAVALALAAVISLLVFHWRLPMSQNVTGPRPLPGVILPNLLWSMSEPVPASTKEMIHSMSAYAKAVQGSIDEKELETVFPWRTLDIQYRTWVRPSGVGEWTELVKVIPIRFQHEPTYAEIVFELHKAAHEQLREDDHHFFEGLEFLNSNAGKEAPVYLLVLGS